MYQFEGELHMVPIEVEYQLKVFERRALGTPRLSKMYEHIAYELRYEHLSSIKHGSTCMKAQFI